MGMNKNGIYFFTDAMIFVMILLLAVLFLQPSVTYSQNPIQSIWLTNDVVGILSQMTLTDIDPVLEQQLVTNRLIYESGMPITFVVGELWSKGEFQTATDIVEMILQPLIPHYKNLGVYLDDDEVFLQGTHSDSSAISGWRMVSGIDRERPLRGFVANARAQNIRSVNEKIISISPKGSGWRGGELILTKHFDLEDMSVIDAELILSVHSEQNTNDVLVDFNNGQCSFNRNYFTWSYGMSDANVGVGNVSSCVNSGENTLEIRMFHPSYNSHTHPGLVLKLTLEEQVELQIQDPQISERIYFSDIQSIEFLNRGAGVWGTLPFYIPNDAIDPQVTIQIVAQNVRDTSGSLTFPSWDGFRLRRNHDYNLFLNELQPIHTTGNPPLNPIFVYSPEDLAPYIIPGTNTISLYINSFGDTVWGSGWSRLVSEPFTNPGGSSFVEINYTLPSVVPYGLIELTAVDTFPPPDLRDKTVSFSYPLQAVRKGSTFIHLTQRFSNSITVWAGTSNPPTNQVYQSPSVRAVPSSIGISSSNFELDQTNYIRILEFIDIGVFSHENSYIEYSYYIPSFVSYGDVFATEQEAIDDALLRLESLFGDQILSFDFQTQSDFLDGVPSLWGPAIFEVRVWD